MLIHNKLKFGAMLIWICDHVSMIVGVIFSLGIEDQYS